MSQSKKILINGCGYTYWRQARFKTWAKLFALLPYPTVNLSIPAVSNQWILDETFYSLIADPEISHVIIQLTSAGKLDVEINESRKNMVTNDSMRNFTYHDIWPSSHSQDHESKRLWKEYLYSPGLEIKELCAKIVLLDTWCRVNNKGFFCYQAYPINWSVQQRQLLEPIIKNLGNDWNTRYKASDFYAKHDHSSANTVPCWEYHIEIARTVAADIGLNITSLLDKIQ